MFRWALIFLLITAVAALAGGLPLLVTSLAEALLYVLVGLLALMFVVGLVGG
jgi:hypothetical protein